MVRAKLGLKTTKYRTKDPILTCCNGLHQLINEPTHFFDSSSSCIDLIFTSQPKLSWSLVFNPLFTQIVIISWYSLSLIYLSVILHLMKEQYGTTTGRMLISSREKMICLTGIDTTYNYDM